jgi:predicted nucleic acid-binding protein
VARIRVVLDACVLLPYQLADLLLRLADPEMYEPLWSEAILDEVQRNLVAKFNLAPEKAMKRFDHMHAAFPNALVVGHEDLEDVMATDPKDRHVAAAAVRGNAALIVTANTRDFPHEALAPYDIQTAHPDDFLQDQLDLSPALTLECLERQRAEYTRPQFTFTEFHMTLTTTVPGFAALAAAAERASRTIEGPAPLEIVSPEAAHQAFFPEQNPEPSDPLGAAYLWWSALLAKSELTDALHALQICATFAVLARLLVGVQVGNLLRRGKRASSPRAISPRVRRVHPFIVVHRANRRAGHRVVYPYLARVRLICCEPVDSTRPDTQGPAVGRRWDDAVRRAVFPTTTTSLT